MDSLKLHNNPSELRTFLTKELFIKTYAQFVEQANKNAVSKKANGPRIPLTMSFANGNNTLDGGNLSQHFGQGVASSTPYINWWVVSIYYIVNDSKVIVGIEEDRYPHLDKMRSLKSERIGNKKSNVAIFYESSSEDIDFAEFYNTFIGVCEEVISIGLT